MKRVLLPVALLAALATGVAVPAAQAATPRCTALKGKNVLTSGSAIRVVDRTYRKSNGRIGHRYVACPRNREFSGSARQLTLRASRAGGRLQLLDSRGAMLAVRDVSSRAVHIWDVASRKRRRLQSGGLNPSGRVLVGAAGEAVGSFGGELFGFDYDGTSYPLEGGVDPSSLRHGEGSVITWEGGTADLSEPAVPCARVRGTQIASTPQLKIVSFRYRSEFLEGALDGITERIRACASSGGPVRVLGESTFSADGPQGGAGVEVVAYDGARVLTLQQTSDSGGDFTPKWLTMHDIAAGQERRFWGNTDAEGPNAQLGDPAGYAMSASGHAAVVFTVSGTGPDEEQVVGFFPDGRPRVLDRAAAPAIDETATSMVGTVVEWTRDGQRRRADLAAAPPAR